MNPSAWIAIATFMLIQTGGIAFALGRLFQRVAAVEKNNDALSGLATSLARIEVHQAHQTKTMDDLTARLAWVTTPAPAHEPKPAARRAAK